ncbi:hypothetical protein DFJ73DRAFT_943253 [Zopfochytrium polystomum]|nr:hypothetical protein DFJ73DRAFT_943253 [Zopfochytrium polystomum]
MVHSPARILFASESSSSSSTSRSLSTTAPVFFASTRLRSWKRTTRRSATKRRLDAGCRRGHHDSKGGIGFTSRVPFVHLIFLLLLAVATTHGEAATPPTQGSTCTQGVRYSSGSLSTCPASVVAYDTAVSLEDQPSVDAALAPIVASLTLAVQDGDANCFSALLALACGDAFPMCVDGGTQLPCRSACDTAVSVCTGYFAKVGLLPSLQAATQGCAAVSSADPEAYPTTTCFVPPAIQAAAAASAASGNATTTVTSTPSATPTPGTPNNNSSAPPAASCPAFFVPASSREAAAASRSCDPTSGCCIPCPYQSRFYPVGAFDRIVFTTIVLNISSSILSFYVLLSWLVLPGRREHPGNLLIHLSVAVVIWMGFQFLLVGDPRRLQCADAATTATSKNSVICFVHGAVIIYCSTATVLWAAFMVLNVHLNIVWRSNVLSRYKTVGTVVCWGVPAVVTVACFLFAKVDATVGIACFVSPDLANQFVFALDGSVTLLAFIATIWTVVHIAVMSSRSWGESDANGSMGSGSTPSGVTSVVARAAKSKRNYLLVVKTNWRALAFGSLFVITYGTYVTFFNLFVVPTTRFDITTPWVQSWTACVVSTYATTLDLDETQNECAAKIAGNVPSLASLYAAAVVTGAIGVWGFCLFGLNLQVLRDWRTFCTRGRLRRRQVTSPTVITNGAISPGVDARWASLGENSANQSLPGAYPPMTKHLQFEQEQTHSNHHSPRSPFMRKDSLTFPSQPVSWYQPESNGSSSSSNGGGGGSSVVGGSVVPWPEVLNYQSTLGGRGSLSVMDPEPNWLQRENGSTASRLVPALQPLSPLEHQQQERQRQQYLLERHQQFYQQQQMYTESLEATSPNARWNPQMDERQTHG